MELGGTEANSLIYEMFPWTWKASKSVVTLAFTKKLRIRGSMMSQRTLFIGFSGGICVIDSDVF